MKTILLFLLLLTSQLVSAQEKPYHQFEENAICYLIADNVNVREEASSKGKVVANIPIGTEVKILKKADQTLKLNGFETNWYKVEFKTATGKQSGYVWGGLIADGWVTCNNDKSIKFMYGIASCKIEEKEYYTEYNIKIQLRACKANKEIAKLEFETRGDLSIWHELKNYGSKGLSNVKDVLVFSVSQQMCAGINADETIFWDGSIFIFVLEQTPGGDAPYFSSDYLVYPEDEGGKKDRIFRIEQSGEVTDNNDVLLDLDKKVEYQWTGTELKLVKVIKDKKTE